MIGDDFRRRAAPYDPAVDEARRARADQAQARALAAREKLAHQRELLAGAHEVLTELRRIALSMNVDLNTRVKAGVAYLDRVLPRQKSVEFTGEVGVQVEHRAYLGPSERVAQMDFDLALEDARRRLLENDARAQTLDGVLEQRGILIGQRGDDDGQL